MYYNQDFKKSKKKEIYIYRDIYIKLRIISHKIEMKIHKHPDLLVTDSIITLNQRHISYFAYNNETFKYYVYQKETIIMVWFFLFKNRAVHVDVLTHAINKLWLTP